MKSDRDFGSVVMNLQVFSSSELVAFAGFREEL